MFTIVSKPQTETPLYRDVHPWSHQLFTQDPQTLPVHMRSPIAHGYGKEGLSAITKIRDAAIAFSKMPLVGEVRLHPGGNTEIVRRMDDGKFAYLSIYGGHFFQFMPVSAGEILHNLIKAAEWPRKKYEFPGIAGFQQAPDGVYHGGSLNDPRGYTFDYRIAPDGMEFNIHTCSTYLDVYRISEEEASEAIKKYFGI